MKIVKYLTLVIVVLTFFNCQKNDFEFGEIITPSNIDVTFDIVGKDAANPFGDGSGVVNFSVTAQNVVSYKFVVNNTAYTTLSGKQTINFSTLGVNTYTVTVIANGTAGVTSSKNIEVEVLATYAPPIDLLEKLYGSGTKTWRIKSEKDKHFGLGPVGGNIPSEFFGAGPEEKVGVGMYDDRYIFNQDGTFTHITDNTNDDPTLNTAGTVFGRVGLIDALGTGSGTVNGADVENLDYSDYSETWSLTAPGGVETLNLSGLGFIGYYVGGSHSYKIVNRDVPNEMLLKITDGNNEFDWWFIITSDDTATTTVNYTYTNLLWEDTFDTPGAPDPTNWTYDIGTGTNGWGNNEVQYYTDRADNVKVENGNLIITAKKESFMGSEYTSARLKTQGLRNFMYGRVEVRAKLPEAQGTWPAFWLLGSNFPTAGWPNCGEIDIMEQRGDDKNSISSALHYVGNSGGSAPTESTTVSNASSEFHTYTVEWKNDEIIFALDDVLFYSFANDGTLPFNQDFFMIFNVAMGGDLGGAIDPTFTESTMEIDYIKVYQ